MFKQNFLMLMQISSGLFFGPGESYPDNYPAFRARPGFSYAPRILTMVFSS